MRTISTPIEPKSKKLLTGKTTSQYRALAVSGLAYATDQIPRHFADLPGVAEIDHNAEMILHGGYASVTVTW